jgi:hypothetical protein
MMEWSRPRPRTSTPAKGPVADKERKHGEANAGGAALP